MWWFCFHSNERQKRLILNPSLISQRLTGKDIVLDFLPEA